MNLFTFLDQNSKDYIMTGSKAIYPEGKCNDIDYAVLVEDRAKMDRLLKEKNWKPGGDYVGKNFTSYRRGEINLIVMSDPKFFACWKVATKMATQLQCSTKAERIVVFETVMIPLGYRVAKSPNSMEFSDV